MNGIPHAHVSQRRGYTFYGCPECGVSINVGTMLGWAKKEVYVKHWAERHGANGGRDPTSEEAAPQHLKQAPLYLGRCPVCGDPVEVCPAHEETADPEGSRRRRLHNGGNHILCSSRGCEQAPKVREGFGDGT